MKIVIIGAGMAGAVAAGALSSYQPDVYDSAENEQQSRKHKAVMRMRNPNVGLLMGVDTEDVRVHKAIAFEGKIQYTTDVKLNNMYSLKTYGALGFRSLEDLGVVNRYILTSDFSIKGVHYGNRLVGINTGELGFIDDYSNHHSIPSTTGYVDYDVCISTIPMPVMLKACGIEARINFEHNPIYVYRGHTVKDSTVHQTLYYPSDNTPIYRVTVQNRDIIIEAMERVAPADMRSAMRCFGLREMHYSIDVTANEQSMGKMLPVDDQQRKRHILELTEKFNVYSFGRFAIWKSIRADHLLKDIELIKAMIKDSSGYTTKKALGG